MFSGLNNIKVFDVFSDWIYTDDYGLTEGEVVALAKLSDFDINTARAWYNGVKVGGKAIYNTYSMMSYLDSGKFECFWGKSGTMHLITELLNENRKSTIAKLLNGEKIEVAITNRISLHHLSDRASDQAFYSLLVQAGYLGLYENDPSRAGFALVSIPNTELMTVWKEFILEKLYPDMPEIKALFDNSDNLEAFSKDLEYFLNDRLSYHDLAVRKDEDSRRVHERLYHIFLLGILSAYDDVSCRYPQSNRESGDGRYDILVEKQNTNFIFEFKACEAKDALESKASEALAQIEVKRYGADLGKDKRLVKIGIAFSGKMCKVKCGV